MIENKLLIEKNVFLHAYTWFETGGPAEYFCKTRSTQECLEAVSWAHEHKMPITLLGAGANVLVSDAGCKGLVLKPDMQDIYFIEKDDQHVLVTAGAGVTIENLIEWSLQNNILGLEEFSGIPGTVGGALYINIHYFKFLISQFVYEAKVLCLDTQEIFTVSTEWFNFGYNTSTLLQKKHCLLEATFLLKKGIQEDVWYAKGRSHEIIRHRRQRYPYKGTCGSFFRNFLPEEVSIESNGKKMIFIAYYLDKVGVKGTLKHGGAGVSHQHANMIVNQSHASSDDIINVARTMQSLVKKEFNIVPKPECELIGFEEYPLYV